MKRNWLAVAALMLTSCQNKDVLDVRWERELGVVDPALSSVQMLSAPTTARVNVPFTVTIRTLGSRSCTRAESTDVTVSGLNVDITPYDEHARQASVCPPVTSWPIEHIAQVTVASAGQARIRVHARNRDGSDMSYDAALTITP